MRPGRYPAFLFLVGLLCCGVPAAPHAAALGQAIQPAVKEAPQKIPPALTHYLGREIANTMHYTGAPWLVRESRQREEDCKRLLAALGLKRGQTVCDMGCGNGFYTLQLARLVGPKGKVYAVDIQAEMLEMLKQRAKRAGVANAVPVLGSVVDPRLPEGQIDLVLLVDVYHEFSHPEQMLAAIRKALRPEGRIALAEFRSEDRNVPILPLHKMSKKQILKEFTANRFRLVEQFDGLPWQHLMFFRRDDASAARRE
jgi:ubiquinone/menaquinone biosynthesis C-methylase UbiE